MAATLASCSRLSCYWSGLPQDTSSPLRAHIRRSSTVDAVRFRPARGLHVSSMHKKKKRQAYASRKTEVEILVPVQPDYSDLWRLDSVVEMIKDGAVRPPLNSLPAVGPSPSPPLPVLLPPDPAIIRRLRAYTHTHTHTHTHIGKLDSSSQL